MTLLHILLSILFFLFFPTTDSFPVPTIRSATCPQVLPPPQLPTTPRVINGDPTPLSPPHFTLLLLSPTNPATSTRSRCTAGRISLHWALTVAHCRVNTTWTASLPPSTDELAITRVINHPAYVVSTDRPFDLALLYIPSPPPLPIPLLVNSNPLLPTDASFVRVHGYGATTLTRLLSLRQASSSLNHVDLPVVPFPLCQSAYKPIPNTGDLLSGRQICAGYLESGGCDSCTGDSGGPLIQYDPNGSPVLIAMVSSGRGCALPQYPGINVRVNPYVRWMREVGAEFKTSINAVQVTVGDSLPLKPQKPSAQASPSASPRPSPSPSASASASARASQSATPIPSVVVVGDESSNNENGNGDQDGLNDENESNAEDDNDGGESSSGGGDGNNGGGNSGGGNGDTDAGGSDGVNESDGEGDSSDEDGSGNENEAEDGSNEEDGNSGGAESGGGDGMSGVDESDEGEGGNDGNGTGEGSGAGEESTGTTGEEGGNSNEGDGVGPGDGNTDEDSSSAGNGVASVGPTASGSPVPSTSAVEQGSVGGPEQAGDSENEQGEVTGEEIEATPGMNEVTGGGGAEEPVVESSAGGGARLAGIIGGSVAGVVILGGLVAVVVYWIRR